MPNFAPGPIPAFSGKGTYIYSSAAVIHAAGSVNAAAQAIKSMDCNHAWVRIHGRNYVGDDPHANINNMLAFIEALKGLSIHVAGWGWCQGDDPVAEAALTKQAVTQFGLDAFVADIEQGVNSSHWTTAEIVQYLGKVKETVPSLAITSHGFIDWHEPALLKAAQPFVDAMNPQAYWFANYPVKKMLDAIGATTQQYPLADPASYARLCVDRYAHWYGKPVILTGQAYVDADTSMTNVDVEAKLKAFAAGFHAFQNICALNWWHFGAMTQTMQTTIKSI